MGGNLAEFVQRDVLEDGFELVLGPDHTAFLKELLDVELGIVGFVGGGQHAQQVT